MKKNFFKKLSFVLALAMIVSVLAPAAGAFAAAKAPKLSASTKYLYLGQEDKNEYDFNIANKQKGWKYLWSSSNEKVADINAKNGFVTAMAAGKSTISVVITDKDGEEIDELTATVVVRDNMKEVTITNLPKDNKLAVDATQDLNRSYVTFAGKKKGSEAKVAWTVTKDGKATTDATIDGYGKFTAKAAGEYVVEVRAFQSTSKKNAWVSDPVKYASYVTSNVASAKITVAASMLSAKQTNLVKFDLAFDSAMVQADVVKNLSVSYMLGTTKVKETVKEVTMSTDGKTATVEMFVPFTTGATYVVAYAGMTDVQFVAATTKATDVTELAILTTTAQQSKAQKVEIALYNKDKVNIANKDLLARTEIKSSNTLATVNGRNTDNTQNLYMYKVGDTTTLTATFHSYTYDSTGKEIGAVTNTGVITCVEQAKAVIGSMEAYTVVTGGAPNFNDVKHTVFKNESGLQLFVKFKGKDANGDDKYTTNLSTSSDYGNGTWGYVSSNPNVAYVAGNNIYAAAEGTTVIVVKYDDVQVAACEITVTGAKKAASLTFDTNAITLSNKFADNKTVGFTVKDQLGNDYTNYTFKLEANVSTNPAALVNSGVAYNGAPGSSVTFTPNAVAKGTYYYTLTVTDAADTSNKISTWISVEVKEPAANATVSYYRVEADKASYDMKVTTTDVTEDVVLSLYSYSADGIRLAQVDMSNLTELKITDGKGNEVVNDITTVGLTKKVSLVTSAPSTMSGAPITNLVAKKEVGTWVVSATSGTPINAVSFEVKDTQPTVKLTVNKTVSSKTDLVQAINDCFDFTLDNTSVDLAGAHTDYLDDTNTTNTYDQIKKIYIYQNINGYTIRHEVNMNDVVITYAQ